MPLYIRVYPCLLVPLITFLTRICLITCILQKVRPKAMVLSVMGEYWCSTEFHNPPMGMGYTNHKSFKIPSRFCSKVFNLRSGLAGLKRLALIRWPTNQDAHHTNLVVLHDKLHSIKCLQPISSPFLKSLIRIPFSQTYPLLINMPTPPHPIPFLQSPLPTIHVLTVQTHPSTQSPSCVYIPYHSNNVHCVQPAAFVVFNSKETKIICVCDSFLSKKKKVAWYIIRDWQQKLKKKVTICSKLIFLC